MNNTPGECEGSTAGFEPARRGSLPLPGTFTQHYADFKWIKVRRHRDDPSLSWEERYQTLEKHHVEETTFLIEEIRKLAAYVDGSSLGRARAYGS